MIEQELSEPMRCRRRLNWYCEVGQFYDSSPLGTKSDSFRIVLAVLGSAVGEAGESPKPPPVRRARVGIVASCKGLRGEV
jgi:hypothetical protein